MARLVQLAVFATLALLTFAAPAPPAARALTKRSFKAKAPGRRQLSPVEDLARTNRKYTNLWEIIVVDSSGISDVTGSSVESSSTLATNTITAYPTPFSTASPSGSPPAPPTYGNQSSSTSSAPAASSTTSAGNGTEDGSVAANPDSSSESLYLSPVTIGGQKFNLDFDTGSADLWVYGVDSVSSDRTAFDPAKSSSWTKLNGESWQITYGDQSGAAGFVGTDIVDVGGSTVQEQAVEVAEQVVGSFARDDDTDGLLGLAFSKINTVSPTQEKTFFDNVKADLSQPLFTADLEESTGKGTYDFGTIDESKYKGDIHYTPVNNSIGFWQITTPTMNIAGKEHDCSNCSQAIVDTGTTLMYLDSDVVSKYYAKVDGAVADIDPIYGTGLYVYPCTEKKNLPAFGVGIGDWTAHIDGVDMHYAAVNSTWCAGGLQNATYQMPGAILGDIFLKQFFVIFDGGETRVGVAEKN